MPTNEEFRFDEWIRTAQRRIGVLSQRVSGEDKAELKVAPPLDVVALDTLSSELPRPIPGSLRSFLERGSGGIELRYHWTPTGSQAEKVKSTLGMSRFWGGGDICHASSFAKWFDDCKGWAEDTWIAESPEDLEFWRMSFPILGMNNGDYLALDQRTPSEDPAVVYLSHDDDSKIVAPSLAAFLRGWEHLYYVGPESWIIEPFLDDEGFLSFETEAASTLRKVLGGAFEQAP